MAVNRLPSGVNVDMGFSDESPMDKLNNLLSAVGTVAAGVGAVREQRSTEQLNSIQMLNSVIDNADDIQDLSGIQNRLSSLPYNNDNDAVNIATEALQSKFTQKREDFDYIQGLGNDIASFVTTPVQFKDSEGNDVNKIFGEMTADEIISYTEQTAIDVESRGGMLENITNNMNKIKQLNDSFERQFGQSRKKPRFTFKNSLGADMNISEFNTQMNRYKDQMEIYMDSGLDASGLLNVEEAMFIARGDLEAFNVAKKRRETEFAAYIPRATRELDDINQQIIDLRAIEGDEITGWINIEGNLNKLKNTLQVQGQAGEMIGMQKLMEVPGVLKFNDANTMYEDALDDISGMSKTQVIQYLNSVKEKLEGEKDNNVKAAISWGFGARYGYPAGFEPSDADISEFLVEKDAADDSAATIDVNKNFIQSFPFKEANQDSLPVINNNPGNLKFAKQPGSVEGEQGFAKFDNIEDGWQALYNQVGLDVERGDTIESFVKGHPELNYSDAYSTTDQDEYVKFLQQKLKVSKNTLLKDVDRTKLVQAVSQMEGYLDSKTGIAPTESQLQATYSESAVPDEEQIRQSENQNNLGESLASPEESGMALKFNLYVGAKNTGVTAEISENAVKKIKPLYRDDMKKMRMELRNLKKRKVTSSYPAVRKMEDINELEDKIKNTDFTIWWENLPPRLQERYALKFGSKKEINFIKYHTGRMPRVTETLNQLPGSQTYGTPSKTFYDELRPGSPLDPNNR
jgi:hypothetical protein